MIASIVQAPELCPQKRGSGQRSMRFAQLVLLLISAGYGSLVVSLDELRDRYSISPAGLGVVIGAGFLANFLTQVTLGSLGDRMSARRLIAMGLALEAVALVGLASSTTLATLVVARCVMGVGEGLIYPIARRLTVVDGSQGDLGGRVGRLERADIAGFAVGPVLVVALAKPFGFGAPFLVLAAVAVTAALLASRIPFAAPAMTESRPPRARVLRQRHFARAVVIGVGMYVAVGSFDALWAVAHADARSAAWMPVVGSVLVPLPRILCSPRGGRLAQRVGPFRLGTIGLVAAATFMALYGISPNGWALLAIALLHWLADGLTGSSRTVAVGLAVGASHQARAQGVLGGVETLVAGVSAIGAGALYSAGGATLAFAGAAVVIAVAASLSVVLRPRSSCQLWRSPAVSRGPGVSMVPAVSS